MPLFDPDDLAEWCGGTWSKRPARPITSVGHDTRTLEKGSLYVALPGTRVDGHALLGDAEKAGAVACMCLHGMADPEVPGLEVEDVGEGLKRLAAGYRSQLNGCVIGVTGSAGKTTVKDMLAAMCAEQDSTCCTKGNWNNQVGLPLSLLAMETGDAFGVFELGMNQPGEIAELADILQPQVGVISSIGEAHLEKLGSVEAIAREKSSLLAALPADGVAVLDRDSPWFELMKSYCQCRVVTVSLRDPAEYRGETVSGVPDLLRIHDEARRGTFEVPLRLPGEHMCRNVLLAVAVARECGVHPEALSAGLTAYRPAPMRWQCDRIGEWDLINDAYNANPLSMRSAIRTFADLQTPGEKWLVAGGMAELGADEQRIHREVGAYLNSMPLDGVVLVGPKAAWMKESIPSLPVVEAGTCGEAAAEIRRRVPEGATLLLKASRADRLEQVVSELLK
ncbi:MAG: UDP-N-acetylmuramoyl-tripeptide--D-alanyl-D-alanine ligase [Kiritimatiellia bacterium]